MHLKLWRHKAPAVTLFPGYESTCVCRLLSDTNARWDMNGHVTCHVTWMAAGFLFIDSKLGSVLGISLCDISFQLFTKTRQASKTWYTRFSQDSSHQIISSFQRSAGEWKQKSLLLHYQPLVKHNVASFFVVMLQGYSLQWWSNVFIK